MPISGVSTDYSGRLKDMHIFQGVNPSETAIIRPSFGKISNYCTGVQKLVQRYAISLLTELGSQSNYPIFGSDLIATLSGATNAISLPDFYHLFNFANASVVQTFKDYQRVQSGLPDDEKLVSATLLSVNVVNNRVSLRIQIKTANNSAFPFILPLPSSV